MVQRVASEIEEPRLEPGQKLAKLGQPAMTTLHSLPVQFAASELPTFWQR